MIEISPLEMNVLSKNKNKKSLAINEISILRQSRQAASLSIKVGSKYVIKKLVSDGVLISTPAGSTAYNMSVHGPILKLDSKKISIAPISAFRPRRWKGKIVSNKSTIVIIIYIIGLIFGAVFLDIWSADTSPKALLGITWTILLLIGLFFTEKDEKN